MIYACSNNTRIICYRNCYLNKSFNSDFLTNVYNLRSVYSGHLKEVAISLCLNLFLFT